MLGIGIDIGTTTICGVVFDNSYKLLKSVTLVNDATVCGQNEWERLQDPDKIYDICLQVIEQLETYEGVGSIGVSGQMHGILYVDEKGKAISPLYSWQDGRGNEKYSEEKTYSEYLSDVTGYKMATGYGLTTHYYNLRNGLAPDNAVKICTIGDYVAMKLAHKSNPVIHKSMAASLGVFNLEKGEFDGTALGQAEIDWNILPEISSDERYLKEYGEDGPAVAMALGDNQASFYGSVGDVSNVLVNIGTGSQISVYTEQYEPVEGIEFRPYINGAYLMVGAPLCGGASYALLKNFFQKAIALFLGKTLNADKIYSIMQRAIEQTYKKENSIQVDTRFCGTRNNPAIRGKIENISFDNFTPEDMIIGMLRGISQELYEIYQKIPEKHRRAEKIVGSGNGIRKNPVMKKIVSEMFGKCLYISPYEEEASCGAAMYAMDLQIK